MTALSVQPTYPIFTDIDGQPLEDGYVWIGVANLAPIVNPITVYWDAALTIPAAQPIRTRGGYPMNSGTPGRLYVNSDYSIQVQNKNGSVVYSAPSATERYSDVVVSGVNADEVVYDPPFTGAVQTNVEAKLSQTVSVKDFGAVGDGLADDAVAIQKALDSGAGNVYFPKGVYLVGAALLPKTTQNLYGDGVNVTRIKASGPLAAVLRYPSGSYNNVNISNLLVDGNGTALVGISMISSSQGACSAIYFERVSIGNCVTNALYVSQLTYAVIKDCSFAGGVNTVHFDRMYSSSVMDSSFYDGSQRCFYLFGNSGIVCRKLELFNSFPASPADSLVTVDSCHAVRFHACGFEAQGANAVIYEAELKGSNTTENYFTECNFIGTAGTKQNCIAVGTSGAAYRTVLQFCRFFKPAAASSITLLTQQETEIIGCTDLTTYASVPFIPVTVTNAGGSYYLEQLNGQFITAISAPQLSTPAVKFPAVQVPSVDANTLDDYEEGTFNPSFFGTGGGTPTVTYTTRYGRYVKIGKTVWIDIFIQLASTSGGFGALRIIGLPFSTLNPNQSALAIGRKENFVTNGPTMAATTGISDYIDLWYGTGVGAATLMTVPELSNTTTLAVQGFYTVAN